MKKSIIPAAWLLAMSVSLNSQQAWQKISDPLARDVAKGFRAITLPEVRRLTYLIPGEPGRRILKGFAPVILEAQSKGTITSVKLLMKKFFLEFCKKLLFFGIFFNTIQYKIDQCIDL